MLKVLANCRLLTIAGVGGMGKTRLALTLAHQVQGNFADGAFFVNLAAIEHPTLVATAQANTLGLTFAGPTPPEVQVVSYLRHKQIFLVLDNFEHLLAGATFVGELVAMAPRLKVLVTSREPLGLQAEWVFTLNGLATAPTAQPNVEADAAPALVSAVELFLQRANQIVVGFRLTAANIEAIQQICQLVEGLPLALELAATWVRTLSCAEIARQIAQDSHFLATHGPLVRDLPARHRSITAVFDHSWRLLNADEQQTLKQLAVFQDSFTPAAAQAVTGAPLATLAALVTKSLVRMNDGRYDLHPSLSGKQYPPAAHTGRAGIAHRPADLSWRCSLFAGRHRGYLAMFVEATPAIYADRQRALAIWRRLGGLRTIALALNYLSPVAIQLGRFSNAQRFLDECLPLAQTMGDRWLIGTAYSHQAMLAHAQGALTKAEGAYQAAIRLFAELHLLRDLAIAQVFLAEVQMDRGAAVVAHQTLLAGLRLAVQIGAPPTALAALLDSATRAGRDHSHPEPCAEPHVGSADRHGAARAPMTRMPMTWIVGNALLKPTTFVPVSRHKQRAMPTLGHRYAAKSVCSQSVQ